MTPDRIEVRICLGVIKQSDRHFLKYRLQQFERGVVVLQSHQRAGEVKARLYIVGINQQRAMHPFLELGSLSKSRQRVSAVLDGGGVVLVLRQNSFGAI